MQKRKPIPAMPDNPDEIIQKKVYLTKKAEWYLARLKEQSGRANGKIIEDLITQEYASRQRRKGD